MGLISQNGRVSVPFRFAPIVEISLSRLKSDSSPLAKHLHAAIASPRKIKGQEVIHRYLASGPDDEGATLNDYLSDRPLKYTLNHDLAIFELRHPLPYCHGIAYSLDDVESNEQVDIYAYPANPINPIRKLVQFRGAFKGKTAAGFLAFEYEDLPIHGGSSGGLVVDSKTHQIVGILSRVGIREERQRGCPGGPRAVVGRFCE